MKKIIKRQCKSFGGLVGKVIAPLAVAGAMLMPAGRVEGGGIRLKSDFGVINAPDTYLYHENGATDGYESTRDLIYSPPTAPVVDFSSLIEGYNLTNDRRGLESMSTYHAKMQGRDVTYPVNGNLNFIIGDINNDFYSLVILADIYKNSVLETENINVRDYAINSTLTPLTLESNSDIYNIDVNFFTPIPGDINLDGIVDDKDASILGSQWHTMVPLEGPINVYSPDINKDGYIDDKDAAILAAHWNQSCFSTDNSGGNVPEPGTMVLLVAGLIAGGFLFRRK